MSNVYYLKGHRTNPEENNNQEIQEYQGPLDRLVIGNRLFIIENGTLIKAPFYKQLIHLIPGL